jgi:excisionase family DNA binding protein
MPGTTLDDLHGRSFATAPETADILGYDVRTVRRAIEAGDIPAVRAGSTYRIPVSWLRSAAAGITGSAGTPETGVPAGHGVTALRRAGDAASPVTPGGAA